MCAVLLQQSFCSDMMWLEELWEFYNAYVTAEFPSRHENAYATMSRVVTIIYVCSMVTSDFPFRNYYAYATTMRVLTFAYVRSWITYLLWFKFFGLKSKHLDIFVIKLLRRWSLLTFFFYKKVSRSHLQPKHRSSQTLVKMSENHQYPLNHWMNCGLMSSDLPNSIPAAR